MKIWYKNLIILAMTIGSWACHYNVKGNYAAAGDPRKLESKISISEVVKRVKESDSLEIHRPSLHKLKSDYSINDAEFDKNYKWFLQMDRQSILKSEMIKQRVSSVMREDNFFYLALAIMYTESKFYSQAKSVAGAKGISQFIDSTAYLEMGESYLKNPDQIYSVSYSIKMMVKHIKRLAKHYKIYNSDIDLYIRLIAMSYNAGIETIDHLLNLHGKRYEEWEFNLERHRRKHRRCRQRGAISIKKRRFKYCLAIAAPRETINYHKKTVAAISYLLRNKKKEIKEVTDYIIPFETSVKEIDEIGRYYRYIDRSIHPKKCRKLLCHTNINADSNLKLNAGSRIKVHNLAKSALERSLMRIGKIRVRSFGQELKISRVDDISDITRQLSKLGLYLKTEELEELYPGLIDRVLKSETKIVDIRKGKLKKDGYFYVYTKREGLTIKQWSLRLIRMGHSINTVHHLRRINRWKGIKKGMIRYSIKRAK